MQDRPHAGFRGDHPDLVTGDPLFDDALTITIFRDPVDRVLSFMNHIEERKSSVPPHRWAQPLDIDKFLVPGAVPIDNLVCRMVLGHPRERKRSPKFLAEAAISLISKRIQHIGIFEYFDASVEMFSKVLGWPEDRHPVPHRNRRIAEKGLQISKNQMEQIYLQNLADYEVYNWAKANFLSKKI